MTISERLIKVIRQWWFLSILLLAAMLIPIWIGRYAPLYDYPNHLLEAQVVVHYNDPQFAYADSYQINPGWYLRSNALGTLLLIGLGYVMPMAIAGHIILSLYLLLFVVGLGLLLRQRDKTWPLLLLAPTLAYNFALTSGWLNFCYGTVVGLFVLVVYLRWQEHNSQRDLIGLAILLLFAYIAHLMAWALLVTMIAAMMAIEPFQFRRHGRLLLAMNSALPLLLITRPILGVTTVLIGPVIWGGAALSRRLGLGSTALTLGAIGTASLIAVTTKLSEPLYQKFFPELGYGEFDKLTFPLRLFALPHQFMPLNPILISYNLTLLVLVLVLVGLFTWSTLTVSQPNRGRVLVTMGILGFLYIIIPTRTVDIWITEPRVLLFIIFIALTIVHVPAMDSRLGRGIIGCVLCVCLLSLGGTVWYARNFNQQAQVWHEQMTYLIPVRRVLMMREELSPYIRRPTVLGTFNRFYTGEFFSATYNIEYGGFASKTFNNGPIRPAPDILRPAYDWPGFTDKDYVKQNCPALRQTYDAVLFWGQPDKHMVSQLNQCFYPGPSWPDMSLWYVKEDQGSED